MTTATLVSEPSAIIYPEGDGLPMADNTLQFRWISTIMWGLEALFRSDPDVFVAGNLLWYPVEAEPTIRIGPDVLVAFGRPKGDRGSYRQWQEGNVAPQVVFEVLSPGNRPGAMGEKFEFYQQHGVEEYYIYDPDDGSLWGWSRAGGRLEEIPHMDGYVSPRLRIRFDPGEGRDNLTIVAPNGARFLTFTEWVEKSEAQERRADVAEERAEEERQRAAAAIERAAAATEQAAAASDRAERLAARLREMGVEPD